MTLWIINLFNHIAYQYKIIAKNQLFSVLENSFLFFLHFYGYNHSWAWFFESTIHLKRYSKNEVCTLYNKMRSNKPQAIMLEESKRNNKLRKDDLLNIFAPVDNRPFWFCAKDHNKFFNLRFIRILSKQIIILKIIRSYDKKYFNRSKI